MIPRCVFVSIHTDAGFGSGLMDERVLIYVRPCRLCSRAFTGMVFDKLGTVYVYLLLAAGFKNLGFLAEIYVGRPAFLVSAIRTISFVHFIARIRKL